MSENLITIKLFGSSYNFKTQSDVEKAKEIADILVKEVQNIQDKSPDSPPEMTKFMVLMLAALNMAGEIYELKQNQTNFKSKLNEKSIRLVQMLDDEFEQQIE